MSTLSTKSNLRIHIKNRHTPNVNGKDFKCSQCSFETNDKSRFKAHQNKHKGIKFQCNICMQTYTEENNVKQHIKDKHTENGSVKVHKCSECTYETKYSSRFRVHRNKHKGIKYQCNVCMVTFAAKASLKKHIMYKHTKDGSAKVHKCSECSYETYYKNCFQRHLSRHRPGVKPFECDICKKKFTVKCNLNAHIKNMHTENKRRKTGKDYKCSECLFETRYKRSLRAHLRTHEIQCDICLRKFKLKDRLQKHIKNKHTESESAKNVECSEKAKM